MEALRSRAKSPAFVAGRHLRTSLSTKKHKLNDSVMAKSDAKNNRQASDEQKSDPFSEIRTKTKLRTRAEIMLEKKGEDSD